MQRRHRSAHLGIWLALALLLPAILLAGLAVRLSAPAADAPVRLDRP